MNTLAHATVNQPPSPTFQSAVQHFLDELPFMRRKDGLALSKATIAWYRNELTRLVKIRGDWGELRSVPLLEVTPEQLAEWPHTSSFGECVRRLYSWHRLPVPRGFSVPPKGQRQRVITTQELARVLWHCPSGLWILWFAWQIGSRPRELRELTWREVFEVERCLKLTSFKAKERRKDGVKVRIIALPPAAARILARWRKQRKPLPTDLVFRNYRGRPWTSHALRQAVRKACQRAGLEPKDGGERIVCYSLRHTFATEVAESMLRQGTYDITLLKDMMGHSSLETTTRYLHRREPQLVAGLDKFARRGRER